MLVFWTWQPLLIDRFGRILYWIRHLTTGCKNSVVSVGNLLAYHIGWNIIGIGDFRSNYIGKSPIIPKVHANPRYCIGPLFVWNIFYLPFSQDLLPELRYLNKILPLTGSCFQFNSNNGERLFRNDRWFHKFYLIKWLPWSYLTSLSKIACINPLKEVIMSRTRYIQLIQIVGYKEKYLENHCCRQTRTLLYLMGATIEINEQFQIANCYPNLFPKS